MAIYQFQPTASWACSAGGGSGFSHSAQTSATAVTVCAKTAVEVRTVSTTKPVATPKETAKPTPKPTSKPVAKPAPQPPAKPVVKAPVTVALLTPIMKGVPVALQKPKSTPKPTPKPIVRPTPIAAAKSATPVAKVATSTLVSSEEASFSPASLLVSASDSEVMPGVSIGFATNAVVHYKTGSLLGKATDVQFVPMQTKWSFGDGATASGASAAHAFTSIGKYVVSASVIYSVSYQIAGASSWISSGSISVSDSVAVKISGAELADAPAPIDSVSVVRLVGKNCLDNPGSFGCGP